MLTSLIAVTLMADQQTAQTYTRKVSVQVQGSYLLSLPADYEQNPKKRYPILLFLHGSGERGSDIERVQFHGPPKEIAAGRPLPFIVVSPQCPDGKAWEPTNLTGLLDEIEAKYRVDKSREYVTGLSLGGRGTYELAAATPRRFAAIAPIAGWADPAIAPTIKGIPIWSTHGDHHGAVPLSMEQPLIDALKQQGADVRFDIIAGGEHDVWTAVYSGIGLYEWLLQHRRR